MASRPREGVEDAGAGRLLADVVMIRDRSWWTGGCHVVDELMIELKHSASKAASSVLCSVRNAFVCPPIAVSQMMQDRGHRRLTHCLILFGTTMTKGGVLSIAATIAVAASNNASDAFSALAPPAQPGLFSGLKRASLKKQLVKAANAKDEQLVIQLVEELSELNPTKFPTRGLGGYTGQDDSAVGSSKSAPLNGEWRLLFTNAKDAEAPARTEKKEKQAGGFDDEVREGVQITTGQRIDAGVGECINYIYAEGEGKPFDQLEITIKMTALSPTRVRLDFRQGRALNENAPLPFLKDFRFSFPPPLVGDILARFKGKDPTVEPPAYFDVLYLDDEIRAHRTGEGKIFVQKRP